MNPKLTLHSVTGADATLEIAGAGARALAFVADWHIRILLALLWLVVAGFTLEGTIDGSVLADSAVGVWVVVMPSVAIYFLYHPVLEIGLRGTTPGKRWAGVRLVTREGLEPGFGALFMRNLLRLVDNLPMFYALGLMVALLREDGCRIGDLAAGTLLVRDHADTRTDLDRLAVDDSTRLDPDQIALGRELLARWKELEPGRRQHMARALLERGGEQAIAEARDTQLEVRLRQLVEGAA